MISPAQQIIRLGFGFAISQALRLVADLEIADRLANVDRAVDDLAEEVSCDADALYRVMRLLSAEGVFREISARRFVLTEIGAALRCDAQSSPRDVIRMLNREPYGAFAELDHSVRTGLPTFEQTFGKARFEWLEDHPAEATLFQKAMIALSQGANEAIAEAYDFGAFSKIVDVGGGHGQLLSEILIRYPRLSGALFDLPPGVQTARARAEKFPPHTEFIAGNFFEAVPVGADAYILKNVIHDWNDEDAVQILRNCRRGMMSSNGKVLIAETIVPVGNDPDIIKLIDVNMLVVTGGTERTEAQYAAMLGAAGLGLERVIKTSQPISILEAIRLGNCEIS